MDGNKRFLIIYIVVSLFISFTLILGIDNLKVTNHDYIKTSAEIVAEKDDYIRIKYDVNDRVYETSLESPNQKKGTITIYYDKDNPKEVLLTSKRYLNGKEKKILYEIIGVLFIVSSVIYAHILYKKMPQLEKKEKKQNKIKVSRDSVHKKSHQDVQKIIDEEEVVVKGSIIDVVEVDKYCALGILYEYEDEEYEFYVDGFPLETIDRVPKMKKNEVDVYILKKDPYAARIDEEKLRKIL